MDKKQREEHLDKMARNIYGKAIVSLLEEEREGLINVLHVTSWEDAIGRQHAVKVIDRIRARLSVDREDSEKLLDEYI